ncbi:unnamed protein product [Amoebophrya sp. A120]|nr:unnamed protein product [Amoebophrya sp. A120]|eukprot:GSA120T00016551001.1
MVVRPTRAQRHRHGREVTRLAARVAHRDTIKNRVHAASETELQEINEENKKHFEEAKKRRKQINEGNWKLFVLHLGAMSLYLLRCFSCYVFGDDPNLLPLAKVLTADAFHTHLHGLGYQALWRVCGTLGYFPWKRSAMRYIFELECWAASYGLFLSGVWHNALALVVASDADFAAINVAAPSAASWHNVIVALVSILLSHSLYVCANVCAGVNPFDHLISCFTTASPTRFDEFCPGDSVLYKAYYVDVSPFPVFSLEKDGDGHARVISAPVRVDAAGDSKNEGDGAAVDVN